MANLPTIEQMLEAGVHFGHQSSRWHPKMEPYIFGSRNGIHIFDLEKTLERLKEVEKFINTIIEKGGSILLVGTKAQAKTIIKREAERSGSPYVATRWVGGFLTNFENVIKLAKKLKDLTKQRDSGELNKYTKREQMEFEEEIARLQILVGGVKDLERVPAAIFVVDTRVEKTAVTEALKKGIPLIAICDTNVNPTGITQVIPANDDAVKGIDLIVTTIASMIIEAKEKAKSAREAK